MIAIKDNIIGQVRRLVIEVQITPETLVDHQPAPLPEDKMSALRAILARADAHDINS